jgi:hypothetical protein
VSVVGSIDERWKEWHVADGDDSGVWNADADLAIIIMLAVHAMNT